MRVRPRACPRPREPNVLGFLCSYGGALTGYAAKHGRNKAFCFFAAHMLERRGMVSVQKLCAFSVSQLHREAEQRASWILLPHGPTAFDFKRRVDPLPRKRSHA